MALFNGQVKNVNKSLKYSVLDGSAYAAMAGLTQNYISPFALALKATTSQIGLLVSIPNLLMALSQLLAPRLTEKAGSRKAVILPVVFVHAIMWLPIMLLPWIIPGQQVLWLILFVTISTVAGAMANPAWGSMMADLVPERIRGRYFAGRGRIASLITLVCSFLAGALLQFLRGNVFLGFAILFGAAFIFRMTSLGFLAKQYEVPMVRVRGPQVRFRDLLKELGTSNLGRFALFVALITFATNLAGPFFSVYMLRDLHLSYLNYMIVSSTGSVTALVFLSYWGRRADRAGNIRIMQITSVLIPFIPMLWLLSRQVYALVCFEVFSNFAWAGFNLASVNFMYDASPPESRTQRLALFNAMNGLAVFIGSLCGGFMATRLPAVFGFSLLTLFAISGILRLVVVATFLRGLREVRHVPRVGVFKLLFTRHHALSSYHSEHRPAPAYKTVAPATPARPSSKEKVEV